MVLNNLTELVNIINSFGFRKFCSGCPNEEITTRKNVENKTFTEAVDAKELVTEMATMELRL